MRQAGAIRRGTRRPARTTTFEPTDVQAVRAKLGASQAEFALMSEPTNVIATNVPVVPSGTELARPFLPSRDFELSKKFYETVGFQKLLDSSDVAIFGAGSGGFLLQRRYQKDWAENCMMQLMVDDLDSWWAHILSLDLPGRFGVQAPKGPALQPWGLRVAYLVDPCGVLWHVAQRRAGVTHD